MKDKKIMVYVIACLMILSVMITGCLDSGGSSEQSGWIDITYYSTCGNDANIYIDGNLETTLRSGYGTSISRKVGTYRVSARVAGTERHVSTVSVYERETTDVEFATGGINVMYDSWWGNDVNIYLNGVFFRRIQSDRWITFHEIETGSYSITARDLGGSHLDTKTITVTRGQITTVRLSYW